MKANGSRYTRESLGDSLYKKVTTKGAVSYELRYTINGKRKFYTLKNKTKTLAREEASELKKLIRVDGFDPVAESKRAEQIDIKTVDDLFLDWQKGNEKRLKHYKIPARIYTQKIAPFVGTLAIDKVKPMDIKAIIEKEAAKGFLTSANKTLIHAKSLFNHAIKLGFITNNPASAFNNDDAGGKEKPRDRALSFVELNQTFHIYREHRDRFTRDNYLAIALLVCLGVRKSELIEAKWTEFNLKKQIWALPAERSKTKAPIDIPLPEQVLPWLKELKIRSLGSDYLLPSRKASKRPFISSDTLNHAVAKMFGKKVDGGKAPQPNVMEKIAPFHPHDLRRTCRSLLAELGTPPHIAEKCLNHKVRGVEGIYDRHAYFDERMEALTALATHIAPMVNGESNVIQMVK
jgi:integrase